MDGKAASSGRRPPWWQHLVPPRWRHQAPAPTSFGPASNFAEQQVEQRLQDPQWATERDPGDILTRQPSKILGNRPTFPPGGHGAPAANQRPYPA